MKRREVSNPDVTTIYNGGGTNNTNTTVFYNTLFINIPTNPACTFLWDSFYILHTCICEMIKTYTIQTKYTLITLVLL